MANVINLTAGTKKTVTVPVGETIVVELEDISTTGYRWHIEGVEPSVVTLQKEDINPGAAPGASGIKRFEFLAAGAGQATLRFDLRRPWEAEQPPIKQSTVELTVK